MRGFYILIMALCVSACSAGMDIDVNDIVVEEADSIDKGIKIISYQRVYGMESNIDYEGIIRSGQGCAIYNNFLFRLHDGGVCSVYDISDLNYIQFIARYKLGSFSSSNHAGPAQFAPNVEKGYDFPLLYVNGGYDHCMHVERVSLTGAEKVQTIKYDTDFFGGGSSMYYAMVIGDDGYIYMVQTRVKNNSDPKGVGTSIGYKVKCPPDSIKEYVISKEDIVEEFEYWDGYGYNVYVPQGLKHHNGTLMAVVGMSGNYNRVIRFYDCVSKKQSLYIDIKGLISYEPEDLDIYDKNKLLIVGNNTVEALVLEFNKDITQISQSSR